MGLDSQQSQRFSFNTFDTLPSGCCFCMRTIDFKELGMFDETYGMYCEDVDLSLRVSNAKGKKNGLQCLNSNFNMLVFFLYHFEIECEPPTDFEI